MTALRRFFLPAALSGGLLWLAFFPVNAGAVALVALAPFLTLVRAPAAGSRWLRYLAALVGGLVFFGLAIRWVRVAHPMMELFTWPVGSLYCALYWPAALYLLRRLDRGEFSLALTLPIVWVGLEYVRTHFPTGFPFLAPLGAFQLIGFNWYALGYATHGFLPAVQAAELGGVYLVSVGVACFNGAAYGWLIRSHLARRLFRWPPAPKRGFVWEAYATTWAILLPVVLLCFGVTRMAHPPFEPGPRVALVQGNLAQSDKMTKGVLAQSYIPLARRAGSPAGSDPTPDLVVWPETCFPGEWDEIDAGADDTAELRAGVANAQARFKNSLLAALPAVPQLMGLNRFGWVDPAAPPRKYNSAVLVDAGHDFVASYDKMHLVPFGEYVPLSSGVLKRFTPYDHDYSCVPGSRFTRFPVTAADGSAYTFGTLICYEDTDPYLARQYNPASGREGVDFLVNISNDGWFRETEEQRQHLAICQFRAVESRRAVVRAVNTGISGLIDPDGRVRELPDGESWAKSADRTAVVRAVVPIARESTLYAALGDWVPLGCLAAYIVVRLWPRYGRRTLTWLSARLATAADSP